MLRRQDRQREILRKLNPGESHAIGRLAQDLAVSEETVRRELRVLEARGAVIWTHGVVQLAAASSEGPLDRRMQENVVEKTRIAAAAAEFVREGDTIFIDAGTTACFVARALAGVRRELKVITNSLVVAETLGGRDGNSLFLAGGELDYDYKAFSDHVAQAYVAQFTPHLAILTVGGVHADHGLTDRHAREAAISRIVYERADRVLLVADHTKFGRLGLIRTASPEEVDILVTDRALDETFAQVFRRATVIVAP
ncbi:DeoR/GlpR family DNA-binding transcription regulator [Caulobacter sp. UNC279MFTsu5.1]|uniref:DeoR/GlpR family DNA-binding transcription regulator n=1 Tax=Caulobacter sp. UNC279MFTsu5.1 TaxID=1502775 RepID=UPI0008EBFB45|nr:DeoR/GlpR family DNA-binding transcription regulator [Caulobacter sp. UNC279MFTsu5.1]SFJ87435.1 transcriptional regulator, DeoR family [Caulobacter sp. UNC279MFTsu5.1]